MNILDFKKKKKAGEKISFITCYDYTSAKIVEASEVDCILVGDSLAMTMYGYETTLSASVTLMCAHVEAVARGTKKKFILGDLPFLSYRKSLSKNMDVVQAVMQAGAQAVKLEGSDGNTSLIRHLISSGVPVMGHIGMTPQSVHALGGFRVQGRSTDDEEALIQQARMLEEAGCFSIVLECLPSHLGEMISHSLEIPTVGIGAGPKTDGQVLVWQDMLGMQKDFKPKFVKQYFDGFEMIKNALNTYHHEVQEAIYPDQMLHVYEEK